MALPLPETLHVPPADRRQFLCTAALGGLGLLGKLPPSPPTTRSSTPRSSASTPEIEPLVRLIEETPRDRLLEEVGGRDQEGAGVPRSAGRPVPGRRARTSSRGRASGSSSTRCWSSTRPTWRAWPRRTSERWLPHLLGAGQLQVGPGRRTIKERGGWRMPPVDGVRRCRRPARPGRRSSTRWTTGTPRRPTSPSPAWPRTAGADEVFELFGRYAPRDFRDIGHKAIFVANACRTLQAIGWQQHAEPVLRSLAYALLKHDENKNPDGRRPGRPPRPRQPRAGARRSGPTGSTASPTRRRRATCSPRFRQAIAAEDAGKGWSSCSTRRVARSRCGTRSSAAAGELLMRQAGHRRRCTR